MTLKSKQIEFAPTGMHADGQGLYLRVQAGGSKSWIFRYQLKGRRREMGLGALADQPAPVARAEASRLGLLVNAGVDPIEDRRQKAEQAAEQFAEAARVAAAKSITFSTVAADYIAAHRAGWANAKHAQQWENTLETYANPVIGNKPIAEVSSEDVLRILTPIWTTKTETASRVRSRIELVLSFAKAKKLRHGENPAAWRGHLDALLPKPSKVSRVRHHPALPIALVPAFMAGLRVVGGVGARALEFAVLTAARSGEVRLMTWAEVDLEARAWTVPAKRMKAGREHRVPLSDAAVELLKSMVPVHGTPFVFPGTRGKAPLSDMTLSAIVRRMNLGRLPPPWVDPQTGDQVVPHGFRSTFRDWAAERTSFPSEMAEMALAHAVGDRVEAAYRRGDMFERRREMMATWAEWCSSAQRP